MRVLAGLIHKIGLITPEQSNLAGSGQIAYKQFSTDAPDLGIDPNALTDAGSDENGPLPAGEFDNAAQFARITSSRWPTIDFIGVWDTVASVLVPRRDRWLYVVTSEELAFTMMNPSVRVFRQAMAIDERRRMFRLKPWDDPQDFMSNPFAPDTARKAQDILQVWFAGVHGDIGGSYKEAQSQVSKYPLLWMIDQAGKFGLTVNPRTVNQLAWGRSRKNSPFQYVAPDYKADIHNSMNFAWRLLEGIPKSEQVQGMAKAAVVARPLHSLLRAALHPRRRRDPRIGGPAEQGASGLQAGEHAEDLADIRHADTAARARRGAGMMAVLPKHRHRCARSRSACCAKSLSGAPSTIQIATAMTAAARKYHLLGGLCDALTISSKTACNMTACNKAACNMTACDHAFSRIIATRPRVAAQRCRRRSRSQNSQISSGISASMMAQNSSVVSSIASPDEKLGI